MSLSTDVSNGIFDPIASRYDIVNGLLSFGFQSAWRKRLVCSLPDSAGRILDLGCGTGAVVESLIKYKKHVALVVGVDISTRMLAVAKARITLLKGTQRVELHHMDALSDDLPARLGSFDAVTTAFTLRNVADPILLLISAYQVLKDDACFMALEFSRPANAFLRGIHRMYMLFIIPAMGFLMTGNWRAYRHLGQSILSFPPDLRFIRMIEQVGFRNVTIHKMAFGAVILYSARK